ncbi:MAG: competence protein CoiA family protein [Chloroflexi bacterium]|nr:competence protein CoiA family protein [Chloroflexota bacterium]
MKFALVAGKKSEPSPRSRALCAHCSSEMIAKCGRVKVWHWAHKSRVNCDAWWENESEWHRNWKIQFPEEWQEVSHLDPVTGERHIADVKTDSGLVVEFQRSPIAHEELQSRESFYGNMIWIVDGDRGSLDKSYFDMGLTRPLSFEPLVYGVAWWSQSRLFSNWSASQVPVFLDFGEDCLWRIHSFDNKTKSGYVVPIYKEWLVANCIQGKPIGAMNGDPSRPEDYRRQWVEIMHPPVPRVDAC